MRLDQLLLQKGLFSSRARAQSAIKEGQVCVDGTIARRPSQKVTADQKLHLGPAVMSYVSRGGIKLEAALDNFLINPDGLVCLDLGASTGGFCDVLLRRGAKKIYAVDVGQGQLHPEISGCHNVINLEKTHSKTVTSDLIPEELDLLVTDVSFISLKKALPQSMQLLRAYAKLIALVKPQFELGPKMIGKNGIVSATHQDYLDLQNDMETWFIQEGFTVKNYCESPIKGGDGNREFLLFAIKGTG